MTLLLPINAMTITIINDNNYQQWLFNGVKGGKWKSSYKKNINNNYDNGFNSNTNKSIIYINTKTLM